MKSISQEQADKMLDHYTARETAKGATHFVITVEKRFTEYGHPYHNHFITAMYGDPSQSAFPAGMDRGKTAPLCIRYTGMTVPLVEEAA